MPNIPFLASLPPSVCLSLSFSLSLLPSHGIWSSQARDQIQATVVTYDVDVATPDP